jgi:TolB-like protein/Tfp pilus assembly protein PilF
MPPNGQMPEPADKHQADAGKRSGLYEELSRRGVIRMAIAYLVVAWLVLQLSVTITPIVSAPEWVNRLVLALLVAGFPFALIFAWIFRVTPDGVVPETEDSVAPLASRNLNISLFLIFVAGLLLFVFARLVWQADEPARIGEISEASIAVLPFTNRSNLDEDEFFVDGIHDDVLTRLSRLPSLDKVISRTTVQSFRGTQKSLTEIGNELGVATILEGGVQRAGDDVRINVQLVDARSDTQMWAESYDRKVSTTNIFAIQSEIANAIARELSVQLSLEEQNSLGAIPTNSFPAYEAYLLGKKRLAELTSQSLENASRNFSQAIEFDPSFALAYVGLSDSYIDREYHTGMPRAEAVGLALPAIERAIELDDQLGEAYVSRGMIKQLQGDTSSALSDYRHGLRLSPNYVPAYTALANHLLYTEGEPEAAMEWLSQALRIDPLSLELNQLLAEALDASGRFEEALAQYQKTHSIDPGYVEAIRGIGYFYWGQSKHLEAIPWFEQSIMLDSGSPHDRFSLGSIYLDLGDYESGEKWLRSSWALEPGGLWTNFSMESLLMSRGDLEGAARHSEIVIKNQPRLPESLVLLRNLDLQNGTLEEARERYRKSYPELFDDRGPEINESNHRAAIDLALVLQNLGERELSDQLLDASLEIVLAIPRLGWPSRLLLDANIYALQGKQELAVATIEQAVGEGYRRHWWYFLSIEPSLHSLRELSAFKEIEARVHKDMAARLATLRETKQISSEAGEG